MENYKPVPGSKNLECLPEKQSAGFKKGIVSTNQGQL